MSMGTIGSSLKAAASAVSDAVTGHAEPTAVKTANSGYKNAGYFVNWLVQV